MYTVLIVDDEELVRQSIINLINWGVKGVKVIGQAKNGKEALELAGKLFPDIVISDIKMPVMDGIELMEELNKNYPQMQLIILSGYSDFEFAQQALRFKVRDYVLKPIKVDALQKAIDLCVNELSGGKPDFPEEETPTKSILNYIENVYCQPISLDDIAEKFNFNPKYVSSLIKAETGQNFTDYLLGMRIEKSVELLTKTSMEIKEIAAYVGYEDPQYFYRVFKKKTGLTPMQYRKK